MIFHSKCFQLARTVPMAAWSPVLPNGADIVTWYLLPLHSLDLDSAQNQFTNSQIFLQLFYYNSASGVFLHIAMPINLHIKGLNNTTVKNNNSKPSIPEPLFTPASIYRLLLTQA